MFLISSFLIKYVSCVSVSFCFVSFCIIQNKARPMEATEPALRLAAYSGEMDRMKYALDNGVDIECKDHYGTVQ